MSEKDEQQYYLLNFTHEELAGLLYKIKHNEVLTTEQYDKLINEIGLDNISTFDLDFYKLKNRPIEIVRTSQLLNDNNFIDIKQLQELVDKHITPSVEELDRINAEIDILKSVNIDDIISEIENIRNNIESMTQTLEGLQDYTVDYTTTLANIYDTVNELSEDTQLLFNNDESFKLLHDTIIQNLTRKQTDINIIFNLLDEIKAKGTEVNNIIAQIEEVQIATTEFANMFKDEYEYDEEGNSTLIKAGFNSRLAFLEKCYGETLGANDYATASQVAEYIDVVNNALDMLNDKIQDIEANEKAIISIHNLFDEYVDHIKIIQDDYSLIKAYYDNVVMEYKETQELVNNLTFIVNSLDLDSINGIDNIRDSINAFNMQLQNYVLKIDYESKISSIESRLLNLESSLIQISDNLKILNSIDHTSFLSKDEFNNQKSLLSQSMLTFQSQLAALTSDLNTHINNFENHTHDEYLTEHQSLDDYATKKYVDTKLEELEPKDEIEHVIITEEEFNKLSEEEQNKEDVLYLITDAKSEKIVLDDYATKEYVDTKLEELEPKDEIKHIIITEEEFNKLSEEEQNREDVLYLVKDIESEEINLDDYTTKEYVDTKFEELEAESAEWQKYKLTNDDGSIKYITNDGIDLMTLKPGNYACIASRFTNPPLYEDGGYVELTVRTNTNGAGTRRIYIMHYIYAGRTFIGYVHHDHNYIHWEEITEKPLPTQEFLRTEINRVLTRTREYFTDTPKNIGFITDTHYVKDARGKNSSRGLDHIKNCVSICGDGAADLIVHGGDIINGSYSSNYSLQTQFLDTNHAMLNSHVPIFPCKGNHDTGLIWSINSGDTDFEKVFITNKEWHDLITDRFIRKFGFVGDSNNPHNNYAYYDFDDVKLRCIMLDTEDLEKKHITDADGKIALDEEDGSMVFRVSPKQLNWLANDALNFEDKNGESWSVMLFSHVTIYSPYTENVTRIINGEHIHQILKSLKEHNTYTFTVEEEEITCDFTNTNHKVIAGVAGHYHADLVLVKDGILYVTCKQSRCDYNVYTDPSNDNEYRALGDPEHEDSWTIFTVDPAERQVVLTRFGSGKNYEQVFKLDELSDTTDFPGDTEPDEESVPCTGISLTEETITLTLDNPTCQLTAVLEPENTTDSIEWTSSNPEVVIVDNNGLVSINTETNSQGTSFIYAKCGTQTASCGVSVSL